MKKTRAILKTIKEKFLLKETIKKGIIPAFLIIIAILFEINVHLSYFGINIRISLEMMILLIIIIFISLCIINFIGLYHSISKNGWYIEWLKE